MNLNLFKKYAPLLFFISICIGQWVEEVIIGEGYLHTYFYKPEHVILRSLIRIADLLMIFILGYIGLSYIPVKWVKKAWVIWYIIVLISAGIRIFPLLFFHINLPTNILSFLGSFYISALSPVPYLFLWIFSTVIIPYSSKQGKTPPVL